MNAMEKRNAAKCETCVHRGHFWKGGYVLCCDYILDTGHSRGEPGGETCTKYEEGNPKRRRDLYLSEKGGGM